MKECLLFEIFVILCGKEFVAWYHVTELPLAFFSSEPFFMTCPFFLLFITQSTGWEVGNVLVS